MHPNNAEVLRRALESPSPVRREFSVGVVPDPRNLCPGFVDPDVDPFPARCVLAVNHDGLCA